MLYKKIILLTNYNQNSRSNVNCLHATKDTILLFSWIWQWPVHPNPYRENTQRLQTLYVMHFCITTITQFYLKTSVIISYYSRCSFFTSSFSPLFLSFFFPSSYALSHILSFLNVTILQYNVFYKGCIQSKQILALSQINDKHTME